MKKFLLVFSLFLVTATVFGQDEHCVKNTGGQNIFCFENTSRRSGDIINITEQQYNDEDFLWSLVDSVGADQLCANTMGTRPRIRRGTRRLRSGTIATGRNSNPSDSIIYEILDPSSSCAGKNLFLLARFPDPVPTLSQWGLMILGLLILNIGGVLIWRKNNFLKLE